MRRKMFCVLALPSLRGFLYSLVSSVSWPNVIMLSFVEGSSKFVLFCVG